MKCFVRSVCFAIAAGLVFAAESSVWAQYTTSVTIPAIPTVGPGGTIPIPVSVTNNDDPVTTIFSVAAEIDATGTTPLTQVNGGYSLDVQLAVGASGPASFNFTVPSTGWPTGTYTVHVVVRENSSTGTKCGDGTMTFTVGANPTFTGRIAYEVYSAYLATPPVNGLDGTIQVCALSAGSPVNPIGNLVQQAVNPKFSPDGSKIVFAGVPVGGTPGTHNSLAIFLYDFADNTLTQLTSNPNGNSPGEDPNFSPDGQQIVYKYTPSSSLPGQLWIMNLDGSGQTQLTSTADEQSGPCFSPTGNALAYYTGGSTDTGGAAAETVWTVAYPITNTTIPETIAGGDLECYYPNYRDANTILYTRWVSANDHEGKVYEYSIDSQTSLPLPTNMAGPNPYGYEDADAFPVTMPNTTLIGFSSTRPLNNTEPQENSEGPSVLYLGDTTSGAVYYLSNLDPNINSSTPLSALGGTYTPYSFARKLIMIAPAQGTPLTGGTTVLIEVEAWSNGGIWSGAVPSVILNGPGSTQSPPVVLQDTGMRANNGTGGEIYSAMMTLPSEAGPYTFSASADSADNGQTNVILSSSLVVTVSAAVPATQPWMLALLVPVLGFATFRALQTKRA